MLQGLQTPTDSLRTDEGIDAAFSVADDRQKHDESNDGGTKSSYCSFK